MTQYKLANSLWPRTGGCPANRAKLSVAGPSSNQILWRHSFPDATDLLHGGIAVSDDSLLRVTFDQKLFAIEVGVGIKWSKVLSEKEKEKEHISPPTLLSEGRTLLSVGHELLIFSAQGTLHEKISIALLDDSNISPCVTYDGQLIATTMDGSILTGTKEIGAFGYDVVPPAVFDDNSLGVSGYYGSGYCRVALDGAKLWRTNLKQADLTATIASSQYSAAGSLNEKRTDIFSPDGALVGSYPRAAVCSEHLSGQWVALSKDHIALLSQRGDILWERETISKSNWGGMRAIVDANGDIFAPTVGGFICLSASGEEKFSFCIDGAKDALKEVNASLAKRKKRGKPPEEERRERLGSFLPNALAMIAERKISLMIENELYVVGE